MIIINPIRSMVLQAHKQNKSATTKKIQKEASQDVMLEMQHKYTMNLTSTLYPCTCISCVLQNDEILY